MYIVRSQHFRQPDNSPITLCGAQIIPVRCIRNLGVPMDSSLSLRQHVNRVVSNSLHHLRSVKSAVKSLRFETAKTLVIWFVISRIDCCNTLLASMPRYALDRLQRVMNAAATMPCGKWISCYVRHLQRKASFPYSMALCYIWIMQSKKINRNNFSFIRQPLTATLTVDSVGRQCWHVCLGLHWRQTCVSNFVDVCVCIRSNTVGVLFIQQDVGQWFSSVGIPVCVSAAWRLTS